MPLAEHVCRSPVSRAPDLWRAPGRAGDVIKMIAYNKYRIRRRRTRYRGGYHARILRADMDRFVCAENSFSSFFFFLSAPTPLPYPSRHTKVHHGPRLGFVQGAGRGASRRPGASMDGWARVHRALPCDLGPNLGPALVQTCSRQTQTPKTWWTSPQPLERKEEERRRAEPRKRSLEIGTKPPHSKLRAARLS